MSRTRAPAALLITLSLGAAACSSGSTSADTTPASVSSGAATSEPAATNAPAPEPVETNAPTTDMTKPAAAQTTGTATTGTATTGTATTGTATTGTATTGTDTTADNALRPLEVLVTNDDGYDAPGIDAVVEYLRSRTDMNVTVVAPATNQSGAGDKATEGALDAKNVTTASGYAAYAVAGFPADSVNWALGALDTTPDLVISGSNLGQNYGPLTAISGTVGAAATAARNGIHAIAISQGAPAAGGTFDFPSSVAVLSAYLDTRIGAYRDGTAPELVSINVPTCPVGVAILSTVEIASATGDNGRQLGAPTLCDGKPANPVDDIDAFNAGHPTISALDPTTLAAAS